jgi:hypothetical protein
MSGDILILVGLVLGLTGVWSLRLSVALLGFGAGWLVSDALEAPTWTSLLVGLGAGVVALLTAILAAKVVVFMLGLMTGAVVGAKLFLVLDRGDASPVLAVVFIPAVALSCGYLAGRWRTRFVGWAAAAAGAALTLSGVGLLWSSGLGLLHDPDRLDRQAISLGSWVALAVVMRLVQRRILDRGRRT